MHGGLSDQEWVQNPDTEATLTRILQRNLFDAHLRPPPPPPPVKLPPLSWQLVGVTIRPNGPAAVIRDMQKKAEYMVRVGDEVEGHFGVRIVQITLKPPSVTYNRPLVGDVVLRMAAAGPPGQQNGNRGWSEVIASVVSGQTYAVKVSALGKRIGDVRTYLETLSIEPTMEGTQPNGLRIASLQEDSFLYAAGLRQGDIVRTVNGKPITDKDSVLALLAEAAQTSVLRVGIVRNRRAQTLSYALLLRGVR